MLIFSFYHSDRVLFLQSTGMGCGKAPSWENQPLAGLLKRGPQERFMGVSPANLSL